MHLELTGQERDFLLELLDEKQKGLIQEINHTDTNDYEEMLRGKVELLERLKGRIQELA
jgi:hypothetical protein